MLLLWRSHKRSIKSQKRMSKQKLEKNGMAKKCLFVATRETMCVVGKQHHPSSPIPAATELPSTTLLLFSSTICLLLLLLREKRHHMRRIVSSSLPHLESRGCERGRLRLTDPQPVLLLPPLGLPLGQAEDDVVVAVAILFRDLIKDGLHAVPSKLGKVVAQLEAKVEHSNCAMLI